MPTTPVAPSAVPDFPALSDRTTYNARAYAWAVHMDTVYPAQMQALASVTHGNAVEAVASAVTASTQAGLATTNGAAQVALATTQAGLATTNGAAKVALATTQANLATINGAEQVALATTQAVLADADRVQTGLDRVQTGLDKAAAAASALAASKLNLGSKTTAPTLDNQGAALLVGATYYDTTLAKWRVRAGTGWVDGVSAVAGVASINGLTGNVLLPPTQSIAYASRATLRSQTPTAGDQAIIKGLGYFVWEAASTEPDDDKTCFATASGKWLMQAVHWDVVDDLVVPEIAAAAEAAAAAAEAAAAKTLTGSATCAIVSLTSLNSAGFTGTVTGASLGDRVVATPPAQLGSDASNTARLNYHAWVSATNTVTVMLCNPSALTATTNPAIQTAWPLTVIKA